MADESLTKQDQAEAEAIFAVLVAQAGVSDTPEARADFTRFFGVRHLFGGYRMIRLPGFAGRIRYEEDSGWSVSMPPVKWFGPDGVVLAGARQQADLNTKRERRIDTALSQFCTPSQLIEAETYQRVVRQTRKPKPGQ
jgi:hypothetical protein